MPFMLHDVTRLRLNFEVGYGPPEVGTDVMCGWRKETKSFSPVNAIYMFHSKVYGRLFNHKYLRYLTLSDLLI